MKTLKSSIWGALGLGVALLCPSSIIGAEQPAGTPPPPPARQGPPGGQRGPGMNQRYQEEFLKKMVEELKLTDEQKKKIEASQKDQMEKMTKLREDTSLSQEDRRAKMRTIREEADKKMKEILTADQFTKYEKMRQEQMQNMRQRGGQGGPGGPGGGQRGGGSTQ